MFPRKNRDGRYDRNERDRDRSSSSSSRYYQNENRRNYDYYDDRANRRDRDRRSPPRSSSSNCNGFRSRSNVDHKDLEIQRLREENQRYKKQREEEERQKQLDEEAQNQKFGAFGDSDEDSDRGGAPVVMSAKSSNKRFRSTSSSSDLHDREKRPRYSDDQRQVYELIKNISFIHLTQPRLYTQNKPSTSRGATAPSIIPWKQVKDSAKEKYNSKYLKRDDVEYVFPIKTPTEISAGIFELEGARFDPKNGASTEEQRSEPDWETISFEDFCAMDTLKQNTFAQSSASKKVNVYKMRLKNATSVKEKVNCYVNLILLEDERVKESRQTGNITGRLDTVTIKLSMIKEAIRNCNENVELRLLEIDILTAKYGEFSNEVKTAWDNIINKFPNDLQMWRRRLTYYRSKRAVFSASSYMKESLLPCLNKLSGILNGTFKSHNKQEGTEDFIIEVIVAAVSFYIEIGSTYKAIGILQALVEFYILYPKHENGNEKILSFKQKLEAFHCYWDSPIAKAGNKDALGWNKTQSNSTFTVYDFSQNRLISAEDETERYNAKIVATFNQDMNYCRADLLDSNCERWAKIEKQRSETFWEPIYNYESNPHCYKYYNNFGLVKPFLIQIPTELMEKAIFKILVKFGASTPDIVDYSQEAIFQRCLPDFHDDSFKMNYNGMHEFVDEILSMIASSKSELFLYASVSRLITCLSSLTNLKTFTEAKEKFRTMIGRIVISIKQIREFTRREDTIFRSYVNEMYRELLLHYSKVDSSAKPLDKLDELLKDFKNIFDTEIAASDLLASLRYAVMIIRDLPHSMHEENENLTKLKLLLHLTFYDEIYIHNNQIDDSANTYRNAKQRWSSAKLHVNDYAVPSVIYWIGDINSYALELYATLCYEIQEDQELKIKDFDACFTAEILKTHESLAEVYFKTWNRHLQVYREEKTSFMDKLKEFVIDIFPRNSCLIQLYIKNMQNNTFDTGLFFLVNNKHEDDVVKILRCALQIDTEFYNDLVQKRANNGRIIDVIREAAQLSSTALIPESYLWRLFINFVSKYKRSGFNNEFLIANDRCPWSKIFLTYAAFLSPEPTFVEDIEAHAKKAEIEFMISLDEIDELGKAI